MVSILSQPQCVKGPANEGVIAYVDHKKLSIISVSSCNTICFTYGPIAYRPTPSSDYKNKLVFYEATFVIFDLEYFFC